MSEEEHYPLFPGHAKGSPTSKKAAESISGKAAASMRTEILSFISSSGGATDDEVESALSMRHQTASARRRELVLLGLVKDSRKRRPTRSGRNATVWVPA